ncbi:MAG: hypothetical protein HYZ53_12715 [Planctomycetes bacterium]|nr:hypothetical protein [Planctomycetota bacterium]
MKKPILLATLGASLLAAGCNGTVVVRDHRGPRYVEPAPPPGAIVVQQTTTEVAPGIVLQECELAEAPAPPPAPLVEFRTPPPFAGAIWVEGNWVYGRNGWRWHQGHWTRPVGKYTVFYPGHWERRGSLHVWVGGGWR